MTTSHGHVNLITGDFVDFETDLVVNCARPVSISRFHISSDMDLNEFRGIWHVADNTVTATSIKKRTQKGVDFADIGWPTEYKDVGVLMWVSHEDSHGLKMDYAVSGKWEEIPSWWTHHRLYAKTSFAAPSNVSSGWPSAATNLKNHRVGLLLTRENRPWYQLVTGSGEESDYKRCIREKFDKPSGEIFTKLIYHITEKRRPDGSHLLYEYDSKCRLEKIRSVSSDHVQTFGWAKFSYQEDEDQFHIFVHTSDGQQAHFNYSSALYWRHKHYWRLTKVERTGQPTVEYEYKPEKQGGFLVRKIKPEGRELRPVYHGPDDSLKGRVCVLYTPRGSTNTWNIVSRYAYSLDEEPKRTTLIHYPSQDRFDQRKVFRFTPAGQTASITHKGYELSYRRKKPRLVLTALLKEEFQWGKDELRGHLLAKTVSDPQNHKQACRQFCYDKRGNVLADTIYGNLTGNGHDKFEIDEAGNPLTPNTEKLSTFYLYDDSKFNLLRIVRFTAGKVLNVDTDGNSMPIREKNRRVIHYSYLPNTNLCTSKVISVNNTVKLREFYEYDHDNLLVRVTCDDGASQNPESLDSATYRKIYKIKRSCHMEFAPWDDHITYGMPIELEERYWDSATDITKLLKRTVLHYADRCNLIARKDVYDGNNQFRYSLCYEYDQDQRMIRETNALGQEILYEYDANGNCTRIQGPNPNRWTNYRYDFSNRLVAEEIEDIHGNRLTRHKKHDRLGRLTTETDECGHTTSYEYDALDNQTDIIFPNGDSIHRDFDAFGNITCARDENGQEIHTQYTILGAPTEILYPDGSKETKEYNLSGNLIRTIGKDGTITTIVSDNFDRPIREEIYSPDGALLKTSSRQYKGEQLIQSTDPEGVVTYYAYDGAGRLIKEQRGNQSTTYEYDALGRKHKQIQWSDVPSVTVWEYDLLDRIIEERIEGLDETIYRKVEYRYDLDGNRTHVITYDTNGIACIEETTYDILGNPLTKTDPEGNTTTLHYDRTSGLTITEVDPLGRSTVTHHDQRGRIASVEKHNIVGELLAAVKYTYDAVGNKLQEDHTIITPDQPNRTVSHQWEYDECNRLIKLEEAVETEAHRITRYEYDEAGRLIRTIKPSGDEICRSYDALGRLRRQEGENMGYTFSYDRCDRLLAVEGDDGTRVDRTYDELGNLLTDGPLAYTYDQQGRRTQIILPDETAIFYRYNAGYLEDVIRLDRDHREVYAHRYCLTDWRGYPMEMQLPGTAGKVHFTWDRNGRCLSMQHRKLEQEILPQAYDPCGNVTGYQMKYPKENIDHKFLYDDLCHLASEEGVLSNSYSYDSLANRVTQGNSTNTVNSLNQLLANDLGAYEYDDDGRLIEAPNNVHYSYDDFDQLTLVESPDQRVQFTYDGLGRRIGKQVFEQNQNSWILQSSQTYLYLDHKEIGMIDEQGRIAQLRLLGRGRGADLGATVAIELNGEPFVPLHDHRCCIVALLSLKGRPVEFTHYSAFGDMRTFDRRKNPLPQPRCPWSFLSKRHDWEIGLIFFGKRYYDPKLGRWISPDPAGYHDGPNLYTYCSSSPHTYLDLYGLKRLPQYRRERREGDPPNMVHSIFREIGRGLSAIGQGIEQAGRHLSITPIERSAIMGVGYALQGRCLKWDDVCPRPQSGYTDGHPEPTEYSVLMINGILTSPSGWRDTATEFAKENEVGIHYSWMPSVGFLPDLVNCMLSHMNIPTQGVRALVEDMTYLLNVRGPDNQLLAIPHSRGSADLRLALQLMSTPSLDRIHVRTFGGADWVAREEMGSAINYIATADPVPKLATLRHAFTRHHYDVVWLRSPKHKPFDHFILGSTYRTGLAYALNEFNKWMSVSLNGQDEGWQDAI